MTIQFNRKPYKVSYYKDGELKTIRRVPPPKLHDMLPKDQVSLTASKNDDFQEGDKFVVKHINQRHPNVLQVTNEDGVSTFVDYYDLQLEAKRSFRDGVDPIDFPENNEYLLWP